LVKDQHDGADIRNLKFKKEFTIGADLHVSDDFEAVHVPPNLYPIKNKAGS
jgi:hypothetical protein